MIDLIDRGPANHRRPATAQSHQSGGTQYHGRTALSLVAGAASPRPSLAKRLLVVLRRTTECRLESSR